MEVPDFAAFNQKQNGIYDGFMEKQQSIATNGVEVDVGGTALQSGFLVALRLPENVAREIGDFSAKLAEIIPAVRYGKNDKGLDNAHITIADLDVQRDRMLSREDPHTQHVLKELGTAVLVGLRNSGGLKVMADTSVRMDGAFHNGTVAIIPGQANETLHEVRNQIIVAGNKWGVQEFSEKGFPGGWGMHSTVSRVLEGYEPGSEGVRKLLAVMGDAPRLGVVTPTSIDVGYFNTDPVSGFNFTPTEIFETPKNGAVNISMYSPAKVKAAGLPELTVGGELDPQRIEALQQVATAAAIGSSQFIREGQRTKAGLEVSAKAEGLVTKFDLLSEDFARQTLRGAGGNIPILGEERGLSTESAGAEVTESPLEGLGDRIIWIVDPLDGTRPFAHGLGTSTTIVAAWDKVTKKFVATSIVHPQSGRVIEASNGKTLLSEHNYDTGVRSEPQVQTVWQPGEGDTSSPSILIENFQEFSKIDAKTGERRAVMTVNDLTELQQELSGSFATLNLGSNGAHYAFLACGGERLAGMITTSIGNPGDVAGVLAIQNSGGIARAFYVNAQRELIEVDPHDVLDNPDQPTTNNRYEIVVAAVNNEITEQMVEGLRNSFNKKPPTETSAAA